jgi:hypothetical protein
MPEVLSAYEGIWEGRLEGFLGIKVVRQFSIFRDGGGRRIGMVCIGGRRGPLLHGDCSCASTMTPHKSREAHSIDKKYTKV